MFLQLSTYTEKMNDRDFPPSIPLDGRSVGCVEAEVADRIAACIENRDQAPVAASHERRP